MNGALKRFPVSTEQVLHPDRFPSDRPTAVDVLDLSDELGPGWGDLDVMEVGEAWLSTMLGLRLSSSVAEGAAAGWDGACTEPSPRLGHGGGAHHRVGLVRRRRRLRAGGARVVRGGRGAGARGAPEPLAVRFAVTTSGDERLREALSTAVSAG